MQDGPTTSYTAIQFINSSYFRYIHHKSNTINRPQLYTKLLIVGGLLLRNSFHLFIYLRKLAVCEPMTDS